MNLDTTTAAIGEISLPPPVPPRTYQNVINKGKGIRYQNLIHFQDLRANDQSLLSSDRLTHKVPYLSSKSDNASHTFATKIQNSGLEPSLTELHHEALFISKSNLHNLQEIGHG